MLKCIRNVSFAIKEFENNIVKLLTNKFPPESSYLILIPSNSVNVFPKHKFSLKDIIGDGFLYASPRNRRTIERRWSRKFGFPEQVYKLLTPKTNIMTCYTCGHHHEVGVLCANCYKKVARETEMIQEKIKQNIGLNSVDEDVIVLYEGEKGEKPNEFWKGKRIIEINKPRPTWFCKNLFQNTTQKISLNNEVESKNLG